MPIFEYKAKRKDAQTILGRVIAENKNDAVEKISQLELIPVTIDEVSAATGQKGQVRVVRVSVKELYHFSRQLVNLLKAGVPILRALDVLSSQIKNTYFRSVLQNIHAGIAGGQTFSDCLKDYPKVFSSLYVTTVRAGEESGSLKETIAGLADYLQQQDEIASKVRTALAYPLLMVLFGIGTLIFVLTYVLPKLTTLFDSIGQDLPVPTQIVLSISSFLLNDWAWLLVAVLAITFLFKRWSSSSVGQATLSRMTLGMPFLGEFLLKVELARFCSTLELLLKSGVTVVRAIKLAVPVISNDLIKVELARSQEDLIAGRSFGESLKKSERIPELMGHLISVGEESGALSETLHDIAVSYNQETNEIITIMTTLLEPIMIVLVGGVIGFVVMAMLLPIFQLDVFANG